MENTPQPLGKKFEIDKEYIFGTFKNKDIEINSPKFNKSIPFQGWQLLNLGVQSLAEVIENRKIKPGFDHRVIWYVYEMSAGRLDYFGQFIPKPAPLPKLVAEKKNAPQAVSGVGNIPGSAPMQSDMSTVRHLQALADEISFLRGQLANSAAEKSADLDRQKQMYESQITQMGLQHQAEIARLNSNYTQIVDRLQDDLDAEKIGRANDRETAVNAYKSLEKDYLSEQRKSFEFVQKTKLTEEAQRVFNAKVQEYERANARIEKSNESGLGDTFAKMLIPAIPALMNKFMGGGSPAPANNGQQFNVSGVGEQPPPQPQQTAAPRPQGPPPRPQRHTEVRHGAPEGLPQAIAVNNGVYDGTIT
jgi:hypothetical protein